MRQRIAIVLVLVALAPLLIAAGSNPPVDSNGAVKFSGPMVNAVVVINAAPDSSGITSNYATIWLQRGGKTAGAVFKIAPTWGRGCDVSVGPSSQAGTLSNRFINHPLSEWVPTAQNAGSYQGDVLGALFSGLEITIGSTGSGIPVITDITNAVCTTNPAAGATHAPPVPNDDFLSFQAAVQFMR